METILYFNCARCQRPHFNGEILYQLHEYAGDKLREMPVSDRPEPGHILWISSIYDQPKADPNRVVTLNLVTANDGSYMPLDNFTLPLGEARKFRDQYHKDLGLTEAQVMAIEASSMFYKEGVRYPENLIRYTKAGQA